MTAFAGLTPSAVLNVEFVSGRGTARSQAVGDSGRNQAGGGDAESWPSWIIRMGLTVIMLPFRAVGMLLGQGQRYEPLPQTAAAATSGGVTAPAGGASRAAARRDQQVEFYNGETALEMSCAASESRDRRG